MPEPSELYSDLATVLLDQAYPFPQPDVPVRFNFDQGTPAPELYPLEDLKTYLAKAIDVHGSASCGYTGDTGHDEVMMGYAGLRETIAERINRRDGRTISTDGIMLTAGSVHALALVARAYLGPGDGAVVESLSFPFMVDYLARNGATVATVPVDGDGMVVEAVPDALRELAAAGKRPKLIYTIPTYQVPTGTVLAMQRRRRLVEIAQEFGVMLVEDNCYYDLYFDTPPPPTLFSLDDSGLVMQTDSFSKVLAPSLRMGCAIGDPAAIAPLVAVREDLGVSQLIARAIDLYVRDGRLDERLEMLRPNYKRKRDITLAALRQHCAGHVTYGIPDGGIYFWLEIAEGIDCSRVSARLARHGVACRPGERFTNDPSGAQFLRLSFLHVADEEISRGVKLLGEALEASVIP